MLPIYQRFGDRELSPWQHVGVYVLGGKHRGTHPPILLNVLHVLVSQQSVERIRVEHTWQEYQHVLHASTMSLNTAPTRIAVKDVG